MTYAARRRFKMKVVDKARGTGYFVLCFKGRPVEAREFYTVF